MENKIYFRIELTSDESIYCFRERYFNVVFSNTENPFITLIADENGFIIWKSFDNRAKEIYQQLLNLEKGEDITIDTFNFTKSGFTLIFFDLKKQIFLFGKDRLGTSSLIYAEEPSIIIASHNFEGTEHPPGITLMNSQNSKKLSYPPFQRTEINDAITAEEAVNTLTNILLRSVNIEFPVLFSGGVDSTIIAGILGLKGAPIVRLINFCMNDNAPDRLSARISYEELKKNFPNTKYELLEYNGDTSKMLNELTEMKNLLIPSEVTEMNLNIAMTLHSSIERAVGYHVIHTGLGADELCCGYMRMNKGDTSTDSEIAEHVNRLWTRNGGRDDRVAMNLGKMSLCPFLDHEFVDFALKLPVNMLIKPELPRGEGEKWILRQVALKLGLETAAKRPKQAMQFGSRVAKANWRGSEKMPQS